MQRIAYFFLKISVGLFGLLPFRVIYILSDGLAFVLYHIAGYRKMVIRENLRRAFPEKTEAEISRITGRFYRNLTDVLLESIKLPSVSVQEVSRRCRPVNPELVNHYLDQNRSLILTGSHLGNWEYSGISMPPVFHGAVITAYKPLTNKTAEQFFNKARERAGMEMVRMEEIYRAMRKRDQIPGVYILLGDQSPGNRKNAHWLDFFGQSTAFLPGADMLGRKFDWPVLYYRTTRIRRGFYEIHFEELAAQPASLPEKAVTKAYADTLESDIRAQPEQWLWSHKRWKMKPEENDE